MSKATDCLRIGAMGVQGRGGLTKLWHQPEGRSIVVAGMDVTDDALNTFKEEVNPKAFTTQQADELIQRDDIDAITVMSPEFTHEEYVVKAFEAGKHVFCEKPMALTPEGCDRMLRAWKASGKQFMIGFNMRYMNIFRVMKEVVDSGAIGEIKAVWVRHFVGHGGQWYFHDWHANRQNSTGLLLQKASHDIDMIHWITGRYTTRTVGMGSLDYFGGDKPNDLHCPDCPDKDTCVEYNNSATKSPNKMNLCAFRKDVDVEDNSTVLMELEGGIKASYTQCHFTPDYCRNYTFIGTEGRVENLDDGSKVILKTRNQSKEWKNLADRSYDVKPASGSHGGADPLVCRDFVDMVLDGKRPVATPLAGRMSVAAGCAATESIRNGSIPVDVLPLADDLKNDVF